jgi:hypothetical protein
LCKPRAQRTFDSGGTAALKLRGPETKVLTLTLHRRRNGDSMPLRRRSLNTELPYKIPGVWAEDNPSRLTWNIPLVVVELKPGATPISQKQYHILRKAQVGIRKHLDRFLKYGICQPCQSPWNTPLLPVQKPGTEHFSPVQDLCAVNSATVTLHPVVPNPYMLLDLIAAEAKFLRSICLDLKDAFFCIYLAPQSHSIFDFQWENPNNGEKGQLTWT